MEPYSYPPYQPYLPENDPRYKKQERSNLGRIGWALTAYLAVVNLLIFAVYSVANTFFPDFVAESGYFNYLVQILPLYLVGFPLFCGFLAGMPKKKPEKQKLGARGWITFLAVSFFLMMAGNYIATTLMTTLEGLKGGEITNAIDQQITTSSPWENLILIVLLPPIIEELMCRKLIIDRLLPYGEALAVTVSGLFFGLLHGNFYQFFYAAFLGLLFGLVYVKTGNILHTIVMHIIINFTGSIIASFFSERTADLTNAAALLDPWLMVGGLYTLAMWVLAICGAILLFTNLKHCKLSTESDRALPMKHRIKLLCTAPGTIVYLVICLLSFVGSLYI